MNIGFTGHKHNDYIKMIYMGARWFLPGLGRFVSADSIVPNPANPQSFNRFSYVLNSPLNFTDPTGHSECGASDDCSDIVPNDIPEIPTGPMVDFDVVDGCDSEEVGACNWTAEEMNTIRASAILAGTRLAETLNEQNPGWNLTPEAAFLLTYGGTVWFKKMGGNCETWTGYKDCWGETQGANLIHVFTEAGNVSGEYKWAIHELGHAFVHAIGGRATPIAALEFAQNYGMVNRPDGTTAEKTYGFAGGRWNWQQSDQGAASEEFADMYIGWVYGRWETQNNGALSPLGNQRAKFMQFYMPHFVEMAGR